MGTGVAADDGRRSKAGAGNDRLEGGAGRDTLAGDSSVFASDTGPDTGPDVVLDFGARGVIVLEDLRGTAGLAAMIEIV